MVRRQVLCPIYGPHGIVKLLGRGDRCFKYRTEYPNRGAQPEVGFVKKSFVARKVNASAAYLDVLGAQVVQFIRQDFFNPASAGSEI